MTIKLNFTQINALAKPELEIFTNSFSYHDNDYFHKNIGSLFGVIQVADYSKNSEYLPNLLTSILKKTFYSNNHKTTEQNFEFALKKANLALADLAEHDIVEWNKNLHALIGVLHKNTFFFTQVGDALVSIGRGDKIMYLSEPDANTAHPIKTFQDIVVGKVELGDKIIISTPTIADIFSPNDINRLFKTFSVKEFDDIFFKTLKKEGKNISAVVVNVEAEEQLDYSKNKSLNNEDLPTEELTKNKNFLGKAIKSERNTTKINEINNESVSVSTGRIKKSTSIIEPIQEKEPHSTLKKLSSLSSKKNTNKMPKTKKSQKPKKELSKKQALDAAQKSVQRKSSETKKGSLKAVQSSSKKIPLGSTIVPSKTAKVIKPNVNKQVRIIKNKKKSDSLKIKSISSSTKKLKTKLKTVKKKPTRKLNDLKNPEEKKGLPDISPFEEMQEIYIKDNEPEKRIKKSSVKKLKRFFYTPSSKEKCATSSESKKFNLSNDLKSKLVKNSKFILKQTAKHTPVIEENFQDNLPTKQTPSANNPQEKSSTNLSKYSKKVKTLIQSTGVTLLKFFKGRIFFLKNLCNKKTKVLGAVSQTFPRQQTNSNAHSSNLQQKMDIKKASSILIKNFVSGVATLTQLFLRKMVKLVQLFFGRLLPFTKKHRMPILIILFIILVPVVIGSFTKSKQNEETVEKLKLLKAPIATVTEPIIENKNQVRQILSLPIKIKLLASNDNVLIAYTDDSQLYEIDKKTNTSKKLTLPNDIKLFNIKAIDYIDSLNLFFLSSDTMTISYSSKVTKFMTNKIILPTGFKLAGQNTYLSYLYLLDSSSKQIYRYPRITGGFDTSKKWLETPLIYNTEISAMAIDENVRVAYLDGTVEKYSRGKLESTKKFELKSLDFIETTKDLKSYYLLNKQEGKILKVNKTTDEIEKEYQNSAIQNTSTFTVDEKTNLLHLFDNKELLSIDL